MNGKYENLEAQIDKLFRENNRKSIKTRYRYKDATCRFCQWLSETTNIKKFSNIKSKHIYMYVDFMKTKYAPGTIKMELSGIRFFYSLTGSKERLPENEKLNLEQRTFGGVKRSWSEEEIEKAIALAEKMNRIDVVMALKLCFNFGTRLEEAVTLTVWQIKKAIEKGYLYLENTKGNNPREVLVEEIKLVVLYYVLKNAKSKERIFIGIGDKTHKVKKSIQDWIRNHRKEFQDIDRINNTAVRELVKTGETPKANVTIHGTRHSYAQQSFLDFTESGEDKTTAKKATSERLGHHRISVTNIYLNKSR
ncbi:tyrosine-type recombinase/integrase [Clostridium sp. OS1-26]|uniref:tyrosine-type recombinase/integrase n=1 Tax=Clostridium sp. OS1-26 TaxID=3070681 RepID=UPI0027E16186|nr:tyrosine-type recombinase/integrase [Clostridium sp. OS1-26]WML35642.1 tyrosine-type recombinase/integrase [Clostridium sp. OS1-26]